MVNVSLPLSFSVYHSDRDEVSVTRTKRIERQHPKTGASCAKGASNGMAGRHRQCRSLNRKQLINTHDANDELLGVSLHEENLAVFENERTRPDLRCRDFQG